MLYLTHHRIINYRAFLKSTLGHTGRWSNSYGPKLFVNINRDISAIGGPTQTLIISIFFSVYLFFINEKKVLFKFISTMFVTGILLFVLKYLLNHNRPDSFIDFIFADNLAFPSGHAMASVVIFFILAKYINMKISDRYAQAVVNLLAAILVFLIGFSRVITGAHDPWQVIAGWCAGFFLLSFFNYFGGINSTGKRTSV